MRIKNAISWIVLVALIGSIFGLASNAQNIMDWYKLRNYDPPTRIVKLADETTMRPETRRIFYINHPELNKKADFRIHCKSKEQSIVLGCYVNTEGIYLLDVEEPRLNGVVEVTAAHEVLHAVYDRLSSSEQEKVDKMTADYFKTVKDARIKKTVENYRQKDASVVPNELHSILATEVMDLPADLEAYYGQYFSDRKQVVKYSQQYEQAFVQIEEQVDRLGKQLESLKQQLESNQAELNRQSAEVDRRRQELDRLLQENKVEEYNAKVETFNQLVGSYNRLINTSRQIASQYNRIVEERNSLVTAEQELQEALDSNIIPEEKSR